jgi:hypothetical protein
LKGIPFLKKAVPLVQDALSETVEGYPQGFGAASLRRIPFPRKAVPLMQF